mmetsp:Transcript_78505/g.230251  ORF Transcript_78505/g.230251 Transcript_78505/m.230251 type:complete len:492 (+) Transcript_78505:41-1516(+)
MMGWRPPFSVPLVLATFVNHIFTFGPLYSFGVFLPALKADLGAAADEAALVYSLLASMQFFGSLIAGLLIPRRLRHRTVAGASSIIVLAGYLLLASMDSLIPMYFAAGLVGLGLGAANLASLTALNARTPERRATAVGIATCGTSIGTMVLAPVSSELISALGWRWAVRLNGIVAAAALAATAPLFWVPPPTDTFAVVGPNAAGKAEGNTGGAHTQSKAVFPPCRDARYLCWWLDMATVSLVLFTPPMLLAQYAQDELGVSAAATSAMYTCIGLCALITRFLLGCITGIVRNNRLLFSMCQIAIGIAILLVPLCRSQETLMVWSMLYGSCIGPYIPLISVILSELFGTAVLPLFHGFSRLGFGIGSLLGPPVIGFVVDRAGFRVAFLVSGATLIFAVCFLALLEVLQARHLRRQHCRPADQSGDCQRLDAAATPESTEAPNKSAVGCHAEVQSGLAGEACKAEEEPDTSDGVEELDQPDDLGHSAKLEMAL